MLFAPEDLAIVRGDPSERRRFLDDLLVARAPRLAGVRADYERVLKQRAALLKSAGAGPARRTAELRTLDVWDGHLADHGAQLLAARLAALAALRPHAAAAYAQVAPTSAAADACGYVELAGRWPAARRGAPTSGARGGAAGRTGPDASDTELDRGVNLVGPHRDDLDAGHR